VGKVCGPEFFGSGEPRVDGGCFGKREAQVFETVYYFTTDLMRKVCLESFGYGCGASSVAAASVGHEQ
jgi:hypothetical protein